MNVDKTKVVIFTNSGNSKARRFRSFRFGKRSVEVVNEYIYLGVTFHCSGSFEPASRKFISLSNTAVGAVLRTIYSVGAESWESCPKLFQSLALSVLFYNCQVWGLAFIDDMERVQLTFLKSLLSLPICTPNYAVRLETGSLHLAFYVLKQTITWINKIFYSMDNSRYPR